jgi:hypothetical protein
MRNIFFAITLLLLTGSFIAPVVINAGIPAIEIVADNPDNPDAEKTETVAAGSNEKEEVKAEEKEKKSCATEEKAEKACCNKNKKTAEK